MPVDRVKGSLTRLAGFGISPGGSDAAKTAQDCVLAAQLEGVSGGDRSSGVEQAAGVEIIHKYRKRIFRAYPTH
jgi:hypothetical protein